MLCSEHPELSWLKREFQLNDAQCEQVCRLHSDYLSQCMEMCERIAATNSLVRKAIAANSSFTPEMEKLLSEAAQLRTECQRQMLEHVFQVSREMPASQGERYLTWVQDQIFTMPHEQSQPTVSPSEHGHD
jgi:hypothetical protein